MTQQLRWGTEDEDKNSAGAERLRATTDLLAGLRESCGKLAGASATLTSRRERQQRELAELRMELPHELRAWQSAIGAQTEFMEGCRYAIGHDLTVEPPPPPDAEADGGSGSDHGAGADALMGLLSDDESCGEASDQEASGAVDHGAFDGGGQAGSGAESDDLDGSGRAAGGSLAAAEAAEQVRSKFAAFDLDHNSLLDRHEVANLLTMLRIAQQSAKGGAVQMPTPADIDRALEKMDRDGDGLVTLAEFEAWHERYEQRWNSKQMKQKKKKKTGSGRRSSRRQAAADEEEEAVESMDRTQELCDRMVQGPAALGPRPSLAPPPSSLPFDSVGLQTQSAASCRVVQIIVFAAAAAVIIAVLLRCWCDGQVCRSSRVCRRRSGGGWSRSSSRADSQPASRLSCRATSATQCAPLHRRHPPPAGPPPLRQPCSLRPLAPGGPPPPHQVHPRGRRGDGPARPRGRRCADRRQELHPRRLLRGVGTARRHPSCAAALRPRSPRRSPGAAHLPALPALPALPLPCLLWARLAVLDGVVGCRSGEHLRGDAVHLPSDRFGRVRGDHRPGDAGEDGSRG